ncbi:unnamed protein product [Trichobilharzia szidati]|nr:unnamed protein product [Trichobilharzia szidati]
MLDDRVEKWMKEIRVIDGGVETELQKRAKLKIEGHNIESCCLLKNDPNLVCDVHKSFLQAGCDIISTNTFSASPETLTAALNITDTEAVELMRHSVRLVQRAMATDDWLTRKIQKLPILIAGSLGPYNACIVKENANKNKVQKNNESTFENLVEFHYRRAEILISSGVDFLAWNKISSLNEILAISEVMRRLPPTALGWITIDSSDGQITTSGDSLSQMALEVEKCEKVFGVGICCNISNNMIGQALANLYSIYDPCESGNEEGFHPPPCTIRKHHSEESIINGAKRKILILLANDGQIWIPPTSKRLKRGQLLPTLTTLGPKRWVNTILQWSQKRSISSLGVTNSNNKEVCTSSSSILPLAQWVGGCCRVGPEYIRQLAESMKPDEYITILPTNDPLYPYTKEADDKKTIVFKNVTKRKQSEHPTDKMSRKRSKK